MSNLSSFGNGLETASGWMGGTVRSDFEFGCMAWFYRVGYFLLA